MMNGLSILIPTYNDACLSLVSDLQQQAEAVSIPYEVIVGDDGSTSIAVLEENRKINQLPHCRLWEREHNSGRAIIRNALAKEAQHEWLLFIDSDMTVHRPDFIRRYIECKSVAVAYGGYAVGGNPQPNNLRYRYEKAAEASHTAKQRQRQPYQDFHTSNFLIRRDLMLSHPFDERFRHYGYEDVLFGKELEQNHIEIIHIDNPVCFDRFESNQDFLSKTEEGLRTLYTFRHDLKGYSRIIDYADRLPRPFIQLWHALFGRLERYILTSNTPWLWLYPIYRLGFYSSLKDKISS